MAEIVIASQLPNSDRLQHRPLVPKLNIKQTTLKYNLTFKEIHKKYQTSDIIYSVQEHNPASERESESHSFSYRYFYLFLPLHVKFRNTL